jgi:putative transposase
VKYACIESCRAQFPVRMMCRLLEIEPGSFYAWRRRGPSRRQCENEHLKVHIAQSHSESDGVYGSPKIRDDLLEQGFRVGRNRIARLMRELGIQGCPKKRYKSTTHSRHNLLVADNHLAQDFSATAPNQRWVADITYIRTREGWLYLAVILDLYSRAIVGWSMSTRITRGVVIQALMNALMGRVVEPDALIHHSDSKNAVARCLRIGLTLTANDRVWNVWCCRALRVS